MTRHFENEIAKLRKKILYMAALVEKNLQMAVTSITEHNLDLARDVIDTDPDIDSYEVEVEEECLKILALHQPVAADLRYVIAVLKINNDLERIADLAVNIAERTMTTAQNIDTPIPYDLSEMLRVTVQMVKDCVDALVSNDLVLSRKVIEDDDMVDELNVNAHKKVKEQIQKHPERSDYLIATLTVSRNLERIADHATNIAEDVIYMIEGDIIRHQNNNSSK